jgi:hypothetical protein
MAFTQPQLDALEGAIATGSLSCEFDGKRVTYRSLDEMMRIRETIRGALGLTLPAARKGSEHFEYVDSAETDRCPRRYITPLSLWLLAQYNAGNLATIWRNGPSPVQARLSISALTTPWRTPPAYR